MWLLTAKNVDFLTAAHILYVNMVISNICRRLHPIYHDLFLSVADSGGYEPAEYF